MFYTIYETTNLINGKTYIGKHATNDPNDGYLGSGKLITRAIRKYGEECFYKHILFVFDNESDMNAKEKEIVTNEFCDLTTNYNMCPGGQGGFGYVNSKVLTGEARRQHNLHAQSFINHAKKPWVSETLRLRHKEGKIHRPDWTGRKHSEDTKLKMSLVDRSGEKNSQYGKVWITDGIENRKIFRNDVLPSGWKHGRKLTRKVKE